MDALKQISTRDTPQGTPIDDRQVQNSAGGYVYQVGDDARVHRFLTLGVEGGTYYTTERALTRDNADTIVRVAKDRGEWLVEQVVAVSMTGRAPRQNPALFALAAVAGLGPAPARRAALAALPAVARTGTHLFLFVGYVQQFRGWGRGLRRAVGDWYLTRPVGDVAYQAVKYRQREGWTHRDLLRLAHPLTSDPQRRALFDWITHGTITPDTPDVVVAFSKAQSNPDLWVDLASRGALSWEMFPDAALTLPEVWTALLTADAVPLTALIRQLPRLTRLGVLNDPTTARIVTDRIRDTDRQAKARLHPVNVLIAARTYASGRSARGTGQWTPHRGVVDALDGAFYDTFAAVQPTGKRVLLAVDVSASMDSQIAGMPVTSREVAGAFTAVMVGVEGPLVDVIGFTGGHLRRNGTYSSRVAVSPLDITPRRRLDDILRYMRGLPFGPTDCSLPMMWALENGKDYDAFVIITDNETWSGDTHPVQALKRYRETRVPGARLVVVATTPTEFTIADPMDPRTLDVSGFDSAVPTLIRDFVAADV